MRRTEPCTNIHIYAYIVAFRNGCHRHSSVETTSTPKLQLFLFALSVCATDWESTKKNSKCFHTKNICTLFSVLLQIQTIVKKIAFHKGTNATQVSRRGMDHKLNSIFTHMFQTDCGKTYQKHHKSSHCCVYQTLIVQIIVSSLKGFVCFLWGSLKGPLFIN